MTVPSAPVTIRPLAADDGTVAALAGILTDVVANGGSVGFMHPLSRQEACDFWAGALASAARGERVVFGAFDGGVLVATVSLIVGLPPNQPHRAEIAKMMTAPTARGRGIATALVRAAEAEAERRGRTLLVLDTATDEGAAGFYERMGFVFAGEIPDFALKPHGGLTGTRLYWKRLSA